MLSPIWAASADKQDPNETDSYKGPKSIGQNIPIIPRPISGKAPLKNLNNHTKTHRKQKRSP